MQFSKGQIDVAKNIRMIEWLKAELVGSAALLLRNLVRGNEELILDSLATTIMTAYVLGKRVGINFNRVDQRLKEKLMASINEEHEIEKWYGDLSSLLRHMDGRKG